MRASCVCLMMVAAIVASNATAAAEHMARPVMVCGPQCVQHVLQQYGEDDDLIRLITEMQDGRATGTSSILDICNSLNLRGVRTAAIDCGILSIPQSHLPAIIHYRSGHFVVIEEVNGFYAKVCDGPDTHATWVAIPNILMKQSGAVVLTSNDTIQHDAIRVITWPRIVVAIATLMFGVTGAWLVRRISLSLAFKGANHNETN